MATQSPRKESQFSGAAAMFRRKEMEVASAMKTNSLISPMSGKGKFVPRNGFNTNKTSAPSPPFASQNKTSNGWKDSRTSSSPPLTKNSANKYATSSSANKWNNIMPPSTYKGQKFDNFSAEPDIKIQVKSDVQRSINARKQKSSFGSQNKSQQSRSFSSSRDESNIPEHIRKARAREQRRLRAIEEKEYRSASLITAVVLGWYVRTFKYPALRAANLNRVKRRWAILTIQKTFRMHVQRKRYRYVIACKRRRERNEKEIKKIEKKIEKMPKKTKQDIKDKKKEYELRKKEMLKSARKQIKEDDEKILKVKQSGKDMIKYLNDENDKVKGLLHTIQKEQKVLEKQFEVLTAKSEEIASNFKSLQKWVASKNESIKKNEASDQKCRYRYLPKYRDDLALRNRYCVTEFRVKELYKRQLEKIIKEVETKSTDSSLVKYVQKEMKLCKKSLKEIPENPIPEGLEHRLKY